MKTMLLLFALVVGSGMSWGQVSSAAPEDGKSYVIAAYVNSKYYALPNGSVNGGTITGTEIELNAIDKVSTSVASGKTWTLEEGTGSNAGTYYIEYTSGDDTYYLYKNGTSSSNKNFAVNKTSKNYWSFTTNGTGYTVAAVGRGTNRINIQCDGGTFQCSGTATVIRLLEVGDVPSSVTIKNGDDAVTSLDMELGDDDVTLSATVAPATASQTITWTSNNTSVATVSSSGVVHAAGTGEATITATSSLNTVYATCTVNVTAGTSPSATTSATSLAFGDVEVGKTKDLTFTVTPANLTGALTISCDNSKYTVSPTSIAQDATGAQTITVTAAPTALNDDMDGTITISGGGISNQTVTLSATPYQVSTVTLSATNGVIQEGGVTKTSITSRVGNTVTLTAVANSGYMFNGWTSTGATPASSNTAETEFTLTGAAPNLTANFIVDPRKYATLGDETIPTPDANGAYSDAAYTLQKDGLTWELKTYKAKDIQALQIRAKTAGGESYIKLPVLSGEIQSISCTVTNGSATTKTGTKTTNSLFFQTGNTNDAEEVVATSNTDESNSRIIDLTSVVTKYNTGYITANGAIRIWEISVTYIPTDINVSVTSAKYATFSDHLNRDFSGTDITVYAAKASGGKVVFDEVTDGIVPANTGVVLYSDDVKNNVAIPVTSSEGSYDFSENEMIGINTRTKIMATGASSKTNYILSNETSGVGFYKATATGAYLPAHRAYLSTGGAGAREFLSFFDNETTGINLTPSISEDEGAVYDLQGRRVAQPTKGLYIKNGKKIVVK